MYLCIETSLEGIWLGWFTDIPIGRPARRGPRAAHPPSGCGLAQVGFFSFSFRFFYFLFFPVSCILFFLFVKISNMLSFKKKNFSKFQNCSKFENCSVRNSKIIQNSKNVLNSKIVHETQLIFKNSAQSAERGKNRHKEAAQTPE
jgi:hypothetical protein